MTVVLAMRLIRPPQPQEVSAGLRLAATAGGGRSDPRGFLSLTTHSKTGSQRQALKGHRIQRGARVRRVAS